MPRTEESIVIFAQKVSKQTNFSAQNCLSHIGGMNGGPIFQEISIFIETGKAPLLEPISLDALPPETGVVGVILLLVPQR